MVSENTASGSLNNVNDDNVQYTRTFASTAYLAVDNANGFDTKMLGGLTFWRTVSSTKTLKRLIVTRFQESPGRQ